MIYKTAADGSGTTKLTDLTGTIQSLQTMADGRLAMLATANARKESGATEAGAPIAGDLDAGRGATRRDGRYAGTIHWVSPPDLYVYEYDFLADGSAFVGTAAPGDGDNHYWVAQLYLFGGDGRTSKVLYAPANPQQQLAHPRVSGDGQTVAFIAGIMSDFGSTGGDIYTLSLASPVATNITNPVATNITNPVATNVTNQVATNITSDAPASARSLTWDCHGDLVAEWLAGDQTQIVNLGKGRQLGYAHRKVLWSGAESISGREAGASWACKGGGITANVHETFTSPPEIQTGRIGHWHNLTSVNAGLTMPARVRSLTWKSDAFNVQGWLLLPESPPAASSLPAPSGQPAGIGSARRIGPACRIRRACRENSNDHSCARRRPPRCVPLLGPGAHDGAPQTGLRRVSSQSARAATDRVSASRSPMFATSATAICETFSPGSTPQRKLRQSMTRGSESRAAATAVS